MPYPDDEFRLSDWLTGPTASILIPALSGLAGALKPVPNRWGVGRGGISGAIEGGLGGLGLVSQMQEQTRKLKEQDALKKAVGTLSAATEPTTVTRNEVNPASVLPEFKYQSGQAGDYRLSELPDFSKHALPEEPLFTSRETTEEKPLFTPAQQRLLQTVGTVAPQTALSAASQAIFKPPREDFTLGENQVRYGSGGKEIARGPLKPEKPTESPFAKPAVPTTKDYTAGSIREWRSTISPESPLGDESVLVPRPLEARPKAPKTTTEQAIDEARLKEIKARTTRMEESLKPESIRSIPWDRLHLNLRRTMQDLKDLDAMGMEEEDRKALTSALTSHVQVWSNEINRRQKEQGLTPAQPSPPPEGKAGRYRMSDGTVRTWDGNKWLPPER